MKSPKRGVVAKAVIHGQVRSHAPGILGVKSQPLHVLRKAAIAGRRIGADGAGRDLACGGRAGQIHRELLRVCQIIRGILREYGQVFRVARSAPLITGSWMKSTPKLGEWRPEEWRDVVADLIFLLIAQRRETP